MNKFFGFFKKIFSIFSIFSDKDDKKEKKEDKKQDHGKKLKWIVPQGKENAGKVVEVYKDGFIEFRYQRVKEAFPAAAKEFDKKYGTNVSDKKILKAETKVNKYMTQQSSNGNSIKVPDDVHWTIYISGGYKIDFDESATRDTIYSLGGMYSFHGPAGYMHFKANHDAYNSFGEKVNIRG